MPVRLNKFLAERIGVSRREADNLIEHGKILIDDKPAGIGARVSDNQEVKYRGKVIPHEKKYTYLLMNKPVGYVCSRKRQGNIPTLYELLPEEYRHLKTVGRLDKDSSGLILLTNDGDFALRMTHPRYSKTKIYEVTLDHPLVPLHQQMISDFGINLKDGPSQLLLTPLDDSRKYYQVTMKEGRNRQIRRTFGALGYTVETLHRTAFGPYYLGDLEAGHYLRTHKEPRNQK
ncbi:rRNA pseudouridine synthase [Candidatus Saccharibacteria bacterium]|nr:rRNA pseudouridine synthase [Candidatus Saccharibacteria bacterium]